MNRGLIVAGIGTDVGKTFVAATLVAGLEADYWKPVQTGEQTDFDWLNQAANVPKERIHPSTYHFLSPESPHSAAAKEGAEIELSRFLLPKTNRFLVVEGAGGLMVPLNPKQLQINLFQQLGLPVVLVVDPYLGAINHTLLSVEALKSRNIPLKGLILNGNDRYQIQPFLTEFTQAPILGTLPRFLDSEVLNFQSIFQRYCRPATEFVD